MALLTAHEMLLKAMDLTNKDKTDTTALAQCNTPFLSGANAAYVDIVARLGVEKWALAALDASKTYAIASLAVAPAAILEVAQYQDYSSAASFGKATRYNWDFINGTTLVVYDADASATVYIRYRPLPDLLVNPYPVAIVSPAHAAGDGATTPLYVPIQFQDALIYKGIAEIASSQGDFSEVSYWETKYFQLADGIRKPRRQTVITDVCDY